MLHSIADPDAFEQLLTIAEELDPNDQRFILPGGEGPLDAATMTLERLWLREFGKPGPDWSGFRRVLTRTIAVAQSAGLPGLADAAASVLVRVLDENEGDPASAVELAELYEEQIVRPVRLLAAKGNASTGSRKQIGPLTFMQPLYATSMHPYCSGPTFSAELRWPRRERKVGSFAQSAFAPVSSH
ncbi:Uncharacterised protein [Agrobacterium tumefaciens]|nr:Uncharacterised protein [Agrobacterium tumefaciens]